MRKNEYARFNRAVEKLKNDCYRKNGLFIERLGEGWEVTVTESGWDRRWTVRHNGRKVAATFRLRPTLLDIRDKEDMSYANALFHALGMEDRIRVVRGGGFRWYDGRTGTTLTPMFEVPELPPSPLYTIFKYGRNWDPKDLERYEREQEEKAREMERRAQRVQAYRAKAEAEAKTEESD